MAASLQQQEYCGFLGVIVVMVGVKELEMSSEFWEVFLVAFGCHIAQHLLQ